MTDERNNRGVRVRVDGSGDAWADAHRRFDRWLYMQDIDAYAGVLGFGSNGDGRLFVEYACDPAPEPAAARQQRLVRRFATVALMDRKSTWGAAKGSLLSTAVYLDLCRRLGETQPVVPRFFFVVGGQQPPWTMQEVDINTGEWVGRQIELQDDGRNAQAWGRFWRELGLFDARKRLEAWLQQTDHAETRQPSLWENTP